MVRSMIEPQIPILYVDGALNSFLSFENQSITNRSMIKEAKRANPSLIDR